MCGCAGGGVSVSITPIVTEKEKNTLFKEYVYSF